MRPPKVNYLYTAMGKPKNIPTPEIMWQHFASYRDHVKANPTMVQDFVGRDGIEVYRKKENPLIMEGFLNYLDDNNIITDATDYFENKDNRYSKYIRICRAIKRHIREDQIRGGMLGIFNASITQRINGLAERSESRFTDKDGNDIVDFDITLNIK
jgi:hypothetical protein